MNNEALDKIEETLAHQEQQIIDLSDMVITQGRDIDLLKKHIRQLENKIDVLEDEAAIGEDKPLSVTEQAARAKPPHY
ncbi:MAG: SlyX family protein [Rhodospirillales bacterium]|nr:SlyX family protein [Rhodospirillales bacterium]